jgi:methylated-DNA-protein-cysteine methyltransferase-like protein
MKSFRESVIECVRSVPKGKVVSYGQVAAVCGHPRAARQVGGILRAINSGPKLPDQIYSGQAILRKGRYGKGKPGSRRDLMRGVAKPFSGFPSQFSIPWWRVINSAGEISIKGNWEASKELQASLLKKEGVKIEKNFSLDINKYRWKM